MSFADLNSLAADASTHVSDALGWLTELGGADLTVESFTEVLEGAEAHALMASSCLEDYSTDMMEVPAKEWTPTDLETERAFGIVPMRRELLSADFAPQWEFSKKLSGLCRQLGLLLKSDTAFEDFQAGIIRIEAFDCTLTELGAHMQATFDAIAPGYELEEGQDFGRGFDYHPMC